MTDSSRLIKRAAIPLSGYVYQNLVGLGLLCDWLDDPGLFDWVKFEADQDGRPQGLDDLVARRTDGKFLLRQVKFTVDAQDDRNALTWDWLLDHKPKGRSLLQKWCDALFGVSADRIHSAALITNRIPSREFEGAIDADSARVKFDRVDATVHAEIIQQLGGDKRAEAFFNCFEFQHSYQGAEALERTVTDRFIPRHTDRAGWLALFREAIDWAVLKNFPAPDGKISLDVVRGTIDVRRPRPLEQSFRVPDGYLPPNEEFASEFLNKLNATDALVLWGSPGQGKSTFLSYVCSELTLRNLPFIRHHYFLDLGDRSDRFTFASVASSLMAQMETQHFAHVKGQRDGAEHLRDWIEACAMGYRGEGKRFTVVVDGLDHVWRENDRDKQPLDSLFRALLPVPDNVTLVVGTQKVPEEQLPSQFGLFIDASAWKELPRMSLLAIESWLRAQYEAGRFEMQRNGESDSSALASLAGAFQEITGSHPLVLTYSFEAALRHSRVLEPSAVRSSSLVTDGDIAKYYGTLWRQLPRFAKDALHLLADAGFIWPLLGLEACLNVGAGELSPAIGHLLYNTDAGLVAFHGSLYAFVREDSEHDERVRVLLPNVISWLQTRAPTFHRWGWQWLYEARAGDTRRLLNLPDRKWVVESLSSAYPPAQIEVILSAAEEIAFNSGDYQRAIRIRWLNTRMHNGPQFQVDDYESLHSCALQLTEDEYPLRTLAAGLQTASVEQLFLLGRQYLLAGRRTDAIDCLSRMRRRINDRVRLGAYPGDEFRVAVERYLHLAAGTGEYELDRILSVTRDVGKKGDSAELLDVFLRELTKNCDLSPLMAFVCRPMTLGQRVVLELACLRLAGALRAKLYEWPEFARFAKHPLSSCWRLLYHKKDHRSQHFYDYEVSLDVAHHSAPAREVTQRYLHRLFFSTVARCLAQRGAPVTGATPTYSNRSWLTEAARHIVVVANVVGGLLARHESPAFALPFRLLDDLQEPKGYDAMSDYIPFRSALTEVSGDLFLLTALRSGATKVSSTEWARAKASRHFASSEWCDRFAGPGLDLLDRDLVGEDIERRARAISNAVSPFNDRAASYIELCRFATTFELLVQARVLLRKSFACVIGYGWRKDPTISFVLSSIEAITARDRAFAKDMLRRLIPIVVALQDMTEDDGARPSDLAGLIIELMPEVFAAYYNHWLEASEWYTADLAFAELLEKARLDDSALPLVTAAVWDGHSISALRQRGLAGDTYAEAQLIANAKRFGMPPEELGRERERPNSPEPEEADIDVTAFSAASICELLAEIRSRKIYVAERKIIRRWFEHWLAQGQGIALLRSLEPMLAQEQAANHIAAILDLAFEVCLQLQGRDAAYRWLVAAQVHCRGWNEYHSLDEALQRYATFAAHYKNRWREFIADTTRPDGSGRPLSIPHNRLVHFLLMVDEVEAAKGVVEAMVTTTVEDFSDQPLASPSWLEQASG